MSTAYLKQFPEDQTQARRALYEGAIFHFDATPATRAVAKQIFGEIEEHFAGTDPRHAQFTMDNDRFYQEIGVLRRRFYSETRFHQMAAALMREQGFDPTEHHFDPMRLRVVTDGGYRLPKAAPVYYPHRDTWYANPHGQLTWWLALHPTVAAESFAFYPEYFRTPVANNSEIFTYGSWVAENWDKKIGWQNQKADQPKAYPRLQQEINPGVVVPVVAQPGDVIVFAGAHLHRTLGHDQGRTRFSIDFRTVHGGDHAAGIGAPNVDDRSRGSTFVDHLAFQDLTEVPRP
ncbi:hypothetical protein [Acanthopleuribacter pedis]|uniref:Phytanoyl-CoA dioxygenase family protein n=1 Tax=Acanthopleuribacter pedis TaxID=442870 RepID=A0A8J7U7Y0_9BACT|nr:hypothetical protein [Acanthopleuribacter pedis]MBO1322993.1 hypothetical protein [Acanthopleuribacter pedis]